jgi:anti-sigma regulatory factor (Ser/Thr protein kinase)
MPPDRFVAATLATVDARNQSIEVWNGGNPAALLVDEAGQVRMRWTSRHPPLGILPDSLFSGRTETISYAQNCDLVLCSDGVVEAESPEGQMFDLSGLESLLARTPRAQRFESLQVALVSHLDGNEGHDDMSCMFVRADLAEAAGQPVTPALLPAHPAPATQVSEWRLELTWGSQELAYLDVVPAVMSMLNQIHALKTHQGTLFLIVSELFNNALDHGLLGLESAIKSRPGGFEEYLQLRRERLAALSQGRIDMSFHLHMHDGYPTLDVALVDSGPGFDYTAYLARLSDEAAALQAHGRGLALVRGLSRELIFSGTGNGVLVRLAV